jgi:hypothetical protein
LHGRATRRSRVSPIQPSGETSAQSTVFDTDECSWPGAVQLSRLPPIYWQIVLVGQKNAGSALKTWPLQKTADYTSSAVASDCELEIRSSVADRDDSVGEELPSGGGHETRIPEAERQRSKSGFVRQISPAVGRTVSHAPMNTPSRRQERNVAGNDIGIASVTWEDLLKIAFGVWAVNLEHAGRPTLLPRTGA